MIIEIIETGVIISLISKTIWQLKNDKKAPVLLFQWFGLIIIQTFTELFESRVYLATIGLILQIVIVLVKDNYLESYVEKIERIPTEKILTEIRYQCSYAIITGTTKIVKIIFIKILQLIETQQLTDERQSKLSQRLLDVSQFIENETQNRCNKSQIVQSNFMDQTLNLNYTVIEKNDDLPSQQNRENMEILKELGLNEQEKSHTKVNDAPQQKIIQQEENNELHKKVYSRVQPTTQIINKPPTSQPILTKVQAKANQVPVQSNTVPQQPQIPKLFSSTQQQNLKQSQSPEQIKQLRSSVQLDSMRKTLNLLESDKKKITEQIVIDTMVERVQRSKSEVNQQPFEPQSQELIEKLQRVKEKLIHQDQFLK